VADTALRELKARLTLDTSDLSAGQKRASSASKGIGDEFDKAGTKGGKLSRVFGGLTDDLQKFGPVGSNVAGGLESVGLGGEAAAGGLATMTVAAAAGAVAIGFKLATAASNLNEQLTASRVVFGASAGAAEQYAKSMAAAGLSEKDALQATTSIATGLKAVGFTDASLLKVSTTLTSLATDLSSFSNIPVSEALDGIQAALRGEFDPLERFGVHLNAAAVAEEAVKEGLATSTSQISAQAKAAATINLILAQTATQQNDVARSGGTLASNTRALSAEMDNLQVSLGTQVLPEFVKVTSAALTVADAFGKVSGAAKDAGGSGKLPDWAQMVVNARALIDPLAQAQLGIEILSGKQKEGTKAQTDYNSGKVTGSDIVHAATDAIKANSDALQKNHDVLLGTFNADLQYQQSVLSARDSVSSYNEAVKALTDAVQAYGPNSQQAKDATEAVAKAQLDAQQSALSEAAAADQLHQKWNEQAGAGYTATDSLRNQRGALEQVAATLAPGSPLRTSLQGYIDQLNTQIPREITTHVRIVQDQRVNQAGGIQAGLATGGPALPGRVYTVGENGPETLVMGPGAGGFVIPHASGRATPSVSVNVTVNGATNPEAVAMAVDRRLSRYLVAT
jgi:hypothetical protein